MLQVNGAPILGAPPPENLVDLLEDLIRERRPGGHHKAIRITLGLAFARGCGIRDGLDDPFLPQHRAHHRLEQRVDELSAASMLSGEEWGAQHALGVEIGRKQTNVSPDRMAAAALALERHAVAESDALSLTMLAAGFTPANADATASATVTAGLAIAIEGNAERWAGTLARGNPRAYASVSDLAAKAGRAQQAGCLRRYMDLRDLDDLEEATENARAISKGLKIVCNDGQDYLQISFGN